MYPEHNQLILYCGIGVSAVSLIGLVITLVKAKIRSIRLQAAFNEEYGKETKKVRD